MNRDALDRELRRRDRINKARKEQVEYIVGVLFILLLGGITILYLAAF